MRYSIPLKFLAIMLAALTLVVGLVCTVGIIQAESFDLYTGNFDDWAHRRLERESYDLGSGLVERYAVLNLSNCSTDTLRQMGYRHLLQDVISWSGFNAHSFSYTITARSGSVVESLMNGPGEGTAFELVCNAEFPVLVTNEAAVDRAYGRDYIRTETVELDAYDEPMTVRYYESEKYTVVVTLLQEEALSRYGSSVPLVQALYELRFVMMPVLVLALALFAVCWVYLCWAAGRGAPGSPLRPGGLNRLPLDLYLLAGGGLGTLLGMEATRLVLLWIISGEDFNYGTLMIVALLLLGISCLVTGFLYAVVAQAKMKGGYWWKKTLLRKLVLLIGRVTDKLPTIWRYLAIGLALGAAVTLTALMTVHGSWLPLSLALILYICVICYGAYAFETLQQGAKRMSGGNLESKIDTRYLSGSYKNCADSLNALADVAVVAARKQMQSERMRTELITNVSHDIKTPLTSIINYVDLLQHASAQADSQQYLEVLGRQSLRLKKLIEDLMELSRASSGNMPVELVTLDAEETVMQALGEFSDKLTGAELTVLYTPPKAPLHFRADGRLTWRVLSNLLSNAVKYAMPGTRIYLETWQEADQVLISLKNISREPLNITPEELTERFVRGDSARSTEGSGLGLNIAKSLMELQKGSMLLSIDGDLFKVTLSFPERKEDNDAV